MIFIMKLIIADSHFISYLFPMITIEIINSGITMIMVILIIIKGGGRIWVNTRCRNELRRSKEIWE